MHPNMVADMLELMYPGRSKVYISDGIGKKLASMKEKRNVVRYSMIAEDIVSYLKEIEEELQSRYELLAKGIESDPAEADYMLLIIDNPDAIEQISNPIQRAGGDQRHPGRKTSDVFRRYFRIEDLRYAARRDKKVQKTDRDRRRILHKRK